MDAVRVATSLDPATGNTEAGRKFGDIAFTQPRVGISPAQPSCDPPSSESQNIH